MRLSDIVLHMESEVDSVMKVMTVFQTSPISGKLREVLKLEGSEEEFENLQKRIRKCLEKA
jgi:hypothetical protein